MSELVTTKFLRIARFRCFLPGVMTCSLPDAPGPLFIGSMSIQRIPGAGVVAGFIAEGTGGGRPGRANLQVSEDLYNTILTVFSAAGDHAIALTYEPESLAPISVVVT
jgi:hypothetical protein